MKVITAPNPFKQENGYKVFLAGSIEMGAASRWQDLITEALIDTDLVFVNPRRENWDASWIQSIRNPNFNEQVNWELDGIDDADLVVFYFDPNTKSPITLQELGYVAKGKGFNLVCCPDGFWRKGNVEIMCQRNGIKMLPTLGTLIAELRQVANILVTEKLT